MDLASWAHWGGVAKSCILDWRFGDQRLGRCLVGRRGDYIGVVLDERPR
jgi:hypothetical protein